MGWPGLGVRRSLKPLVGRGRTATFHGSQLARLAKYLSVPGIAGNYASTPDAPANNFVGDIDVVVKVSPADVGTERIFISKYLTAGSQCAWHFRNGAAGVLKWSWSVDGAAVVEAISTAGHPYGNEDTFYVRAHQDVDDGGGNNVVTFLYKQFEHDAWIPLGVPVVQAGVATRIVSTAPVEIAARDNGGVQPFIGEIFYAEVRDGIDGPVVVSFDPTRALTNQDQIQSATGEVWTVNVAGGGQIAQLF